MDGKGRWIDNLIVERLWRSLKNESVYLSAFEGEGEAKRETGEWIERYNQKRPHSSLDDKTPFKAYRGLPWPGAGTLKKAA